jgi:hypothetical protein
MFIVKIDGQDAAVTNTFESAALYVDGLRGAARRVTIRVVSPEDLTPALDSLDRCPGAMPSRTSTRGTCVA